VSQPLTLGEAVERALQRVVRAREIDGDLLGISSGFLTLDELTLGWQEQDLIVIAARPSMGKTAFALNAATAAAGAGVKVFIASLEMSTEQLAMRMPSSESGINGRALRLGRVDEKDWQKIYDAYSQISELSILIDDTASITETQLAARVREAKPGFLIVDYLQLMKSAQSAQRRDLEIANITGAMTGLAKELNIPVILLSQLSREAARRDNSRPRLTDLWDSGAIEQDADVVIGIYRDIDYSPNVAQLICLKHRNGPLGTVTLFFREELTSFWDAESQN
jgi:replicative DNA helicase